MDFSLTDEQQLLLDSVDELMERYLGRPVVALNDADAAGIAEVAYGAAKGRDGVIVFTTQGTGIGSAIIVNGTLLTNTELGHLEIDGTDAEKNASSGQKTLQGLDWSSGRSASSATTRHGGRSCSNPDCSSWVGCLGEPREVHAPAEPQDPHDSREASQHRGHRRRRLLRGAA